MKKNNIEKQLKRIPKPKIPPDLEKRLLLTIPQKVYEAPPEVPSRFWRIAIAVAACMIITISVVSYWFKMMQNTNPKQEDVIIQFNDDEIQRVIDREVIAARLLASAKVLNEQPYGRQLANNTYGYIADVYPETSAGNLAKNIMGKEF